MDTTPSTGRIGLGITSHPMALDLLRVRDAATCGAGIVA
jgi:hypothetical protein